MQRFCCFLLLLIGANKFATAQNEKASISGLVRDSLGQLMDGVTVSVINENIVGLTNENGYFKITVNANNAIKLRFNYFGSKGQNFDIPALKPKEKYELNVTLNIGLILGTVEIKEERYREQISSFTIDAKQLSVNPSPIPGVEQILKTLPGVSSNNELSA